MATLSKPLSSAATANSSRSLGPNCSADALYPSLSIVSSLPRGLPAPPPGRAPRPSGAARRPGTGSERHGHRLGALHELPLGPLDKGGDVAVETRHRDEGRRIALDAFRAVAVADADAAVGGVV